MFRHLCFVLLALALSHSSPVLAASEEPVGDTSGPDARPGNSAPNPADGLVWHNDYLDAVTDAARDKKMLFILFCRPGKCQLRERFDAQALKDPVIVERLTNHVRLRQTLDAKVRIDGKEIELLKHPAFAEMLGMPGIAMIDFAHQAHNGKVVSVFPFLHDRMYTAEQLRAILDLPPGTLTQRTLIWAVRTHPEHPASASGRLDANLVREAQSHSEYQAQIRLQGHHAWETRFHRINGLLGGAMMAKEVCAESWPGQGLFESAVECVRCWHYSEGHWSAVNAAQTVFGYDMKRGANGVWYATGIFGK